MREAGGVRPRAMRCHASVAHNQILNGASVILSPFIGVELCAVIQRSIALSKNSAAVGEFRLFILENCC